MLSIIFKVGEIKTVLFCFWASIKFHTQKFTLTVISLSLFEILKKWASNVFQERILENEFVWHFLKMHAKPADKEYFHLQICPADVDFWVILSMLGQQQQHCTVLVYLWNTKEILSNCCHFKIYSNHKGFYPILCQFIWPFCFPAFHKAVKLVERM